MLAENNPHRRQDLEREDGEPSFGPPSEGSESSSAPEEMDELPSSSSRRTFLGATALTVAAAGTAYFKGEEILEWAMANIAKDPDAIHRSYRREGLADTVVLDRRKFFPYSQSPLLTYATEERRLRPENLLTDQAIVVANNIADRVAERAFDSYHAMIEKKKGKDEASSLTMDQVLHAFSTSEGNLKLYMRYLAQELIRSQCIYASESSLHSAVDPEIHRGDFFHLDCDLLCYLALHAASRHDMPLQAVAAPMHVYIGSPTFPEFAIEMTEFREERGLRHGSKITDSQRIGKEFESTHEQQQERWHIRDRSVAEACGFFLPIPEDGIPSKAVGNLLSGMLRRATGTRDYLQLKRLCDLLDAELDRVGPGYPLVQNVYVAHVTARDRCVESWIRTDESKQKTEGLQHRKIGLKHAERIREVKHQYGDYLISRMTDDREVEMDLRTGIQIRRLEEAIDRLERAKKILGG